MVWIALNLALVSRVVWALIELPCVLVTAFWDVLVRPLIVLVQTAAQLVRIPLEFLFLDIEGLSSLLLFLYQLWLVVP